MDKKTPVQNVHLVLLKKTVLSGSMFLRNMGHAANGTRAIAASRAITSFTTLR
jgi:hypothetical protein